MEGFFNYYPFSIHRIHKYFGYRVDIIFGCDLITGSEAFVVRMIFERIFSISNDFQRKLLQHKQQKKALFHQ
jgi:hypothetical protein